MEGVGQEKEARDKRQKEEHYKSRIRGDHINWLGGVGCLGWRDWLSCLARVSGLVGLAWLSGLPRLAYANNEHL